MTSEPEISAVVPLYNERENVHELHRRLTAALRGLGVDYEVVFVNDGSRDETPRLIDELGAGDPNLSIIHLSRNFGHQAAVSAGLDHARGRAVLILDGDLQDPPEVIPQFVQAWREGGQVVYAVRTKRKEGPIKRLGYFVFYRLLHSISDLDLPLDSGDFCLMDRKVVEALKRLPEKARFIRGLRTFVGFRQVGLQYERDARAAGRPKYTFSSLIRLAVDGLVSFSSYPLRVVTYIGAVTGIAALMLIVWVLYDAFLGRSGPRGWASLCAIVLMIGSVQLVCLGIIGEYIRLIFLEAKSRPTYVVGSYRPRSEESAGHRVGALPTNGASLAAEAAGAAGARES